MKEPIVSTFLAGTLGLGRLNGHNAAGNEIFAGRKRVLRKTGRAVCTLTLAAVLAVTSAPMGQFKAYADSGKTYYVDAEKGQDNNDGSENSPFRTIQHTVDVMKPGDTGLIREGVYPEEVDLKSGIEGAQITLKNYPGETVVVSGCDPLTGWIEDESRPGEGIYKTKMDWSLGDRGDKNQLFTDGNVMYEARYPNVKEGSTLTNFNYERTGSGTDFVSGTNKQKSQLVDPKFKEFAKTDDFFDGAKIWMVPGKEWTAITSYAESYDPETGTIIYPSTSRALKSSYYSPKTNAPYYIFGTHTLLDAQMEWWYDQENGEIYAKIPGGLNPDAAGAYVEAKSRENAFDLSGCSYVTIEGINLRGATVTTDEESSHILLKGMKGEYVGHCSTVEFTNAPADDCTQDDLGVLVKGSFIEINSCEFSNSSGPVINIQGSDNKLINSYIHDGNYSGTYAGHAKFTGRRQLISNNTICESGRDVVSFRQLSESVIQYNDIYGAGRLTLDLGVMYAAETDGQNTLIHHNYIHDNYAKANNSGLYLDEMSNNFIEYNNVVYNTVTAYSFNQPSIYNLCYNNTGYSNNTIGGDYQQSFSDHRGRQFINNISNKNGKGNYSPASTYINANVNETSKFADAANRDFRLAEGSDAIGAGVPLRGVTPEGQNNPNAGAYQQGEDLSEVGHNFENPPEIKKSPSLTAFEYRNRIKNGGFEYGTLESWSGDATVVKGKAWHSSSAAAATCLYAAAFQSGNKISQTIPVEPYSKYSIGLIARAPGNEGSIKISVENTAGAQLEESVASGNWKTDKRKFLDFTTGNVTEVTITIENTGTEELYVDDIGLQKNILEIQELSKPIRLAASDTGCSVMFEELEEGHSYFYSDNRNVDASIKTGNFQIEKPEEYREELMSGMSIPLKNWEYLNVVEVVNGKVTGFGSIQKLGEISVIQKEAINDGMIRGGKYSDIVQNEVKEDGVLTSEDTLYVIDLNDSGSADYVRKGYLQFDLSDLDPDRIIGAKVKFYIYGTNTAEGGEEGQGTKRGIIVSGVNGEDWDEDTLTWNSALNGDKPMDVTGEVGRINDIYKVSEPNGKYCELDITEYIQKKAVNGTKATVQLFPDGKYPSRNMFVATKENPYYEEMKYHPQLEIQYAQKDETENSMQELYVSLEGDDQASGTLANPLRTLEAARDKIRAMKEGGGLPEGGVTVYVRGGEYKCLEDSFTLGAQDSGTESSPVVYRAYEGEEVKLVGNMVVEGSKFVPVTEETILERLGDTAKDKVLVYDLEKENGITKFAPIPKNGFGWPAQANAMSVLVDGEAQTLSRYPNNGFVSISSIQAAGFVPRDHQANPDGTCADCTKKLGGGQRIPCQYGESKFLEQPGGVFTMNNADLKAKYPLWAEETDIWTSGYYCYDWADDNCAIKTVEETAGGIKMTMRHPSRYGVKGSGRKFYAYNLLCEIDQPGEWYLDRDNAKLYLYPTKDISGSKVELAMQTLPIVVMDEVQNVELQGITFAKSNGHGIVMQDCENVEIAGCDFSDLGQRAVFMGDPDDLNVDIGAHGGSNNLVRSCNITRMGQGGVYVGGGNRYTLTNGENKVVNCDISDFATIKRTYSPAVELVGCGNSALRNRIYDAPHTAVMFSGNDMMIEGNEIFDVCYETADVGAVYSVRRWSWQGTVVKNNYIHDLVNTGGIGSAAVYVDDLGSGVTMTENLLVNIPGRTILFGGGRDNVVTNNIQLNYGNGAGMTYDNRGQGWAWYHAAGPDGECYGELAALRANAAYDKEKWDEKYPSLAVIDLETKTLRTDKGEGYKDYYTEAAKPANATIEKNILVGVANPYGGVNGTVKNLGSFADNQSYPQGTDVGFTNPDSYDFTVKPDSTIKELLGANHFDVSLMGLYEDEFRTLELEPLDVPSLLAPADQSEDVAAVNGVKFGWSSVDRAGSYTLEIARDEAFSNIAESVNTVSAAATVMGLEKDTTYYWRVTAREKRVNGAVSVSSVNRFTTSSNMDTSFFEGFRNFDEWEVLVEGGAVKGSPSNTTANAKSGRYSYELNESMDVIQKIFGTKHNDVVSVWLYDNMNKGNGAAGVVNVTSEDGGWIGAGISVATNGGHKDKYVVRIGGSWIDTEVVRTEGWHELKWDYSEQGICKIYVDDILGYTLEDAPYYDRIMIGDFWNHTGYAGDISGFLFDHITVGEPVITENILSIAVPEESIKLYVGDTYQLEPVVETDPDMDVELAYVTQEYEVARADEAGLITALRPGTTTIEIQSQKNPAIKAVVNVEVSGEANKASLQELFDQYIQYAKADYSPKSWDQLTKAMIQAEDELKREDSTVDSVTVAQKLLEEAGSALEFVAANLLANAGFEEGTLEGFGHYPAKTSEGIELGVSTDEVHSGSYSAKITTTSSIPNYAHKGLMYTIPTGNVEIGAQYTLSFWVKSGDGKERNVGERVVFRKNQGTVSLDPVKTGNEWTYITGNIPKVPEGTEYIEMIMGNENTEESAGTYYIDDVCLQKKTTYVPAEGIRLNQTEITVSGGDAVTLTAAMAPENATNDMMVWTSSDETVASVEKGVVTAKSPGTADIMVRSLDGGFAEVCKVTVPVPVKGVSLNTKVITAKPGQQVVLSAQVEPEDAANKSVAWESSDSGVATVEAGVVTTVSSGDAVITVTTVDGGYTDTCAVTVEEPEPVDIPVASVSMSDEEITLKEGETYDLTAEVWPEDASNKTVTWSSSVGEVASVSDGHVKALSEGITVITVTTVDGGFTGACRVTVEPKDPADIPVNKYLLQSTYDYAVTLDTTGVVDSAVRYFEEAKGKALEVLENPAATKEEVLDSWEELVKAIHGLGLVQGDKSTLIILLNSAEDMIPNEAKYVPLHWQKLLDEREKAKAVIADGDAMDQEIQKQEDALLKAILIQRLKANKENLKNLIDQAASIDKTLYTEESVQIFASAFARADAVMKDETLSEEDQKIVDQAEMELLEAINQLEKKENVENPDDPADPSNPDNPTDPADPSNPDNPTDPADPSQPENPSGSEDNGSTNSGNDADNSQNAADNAVQNTEVKAPKTGDNAPLGVMAMMVFAGALCIGGVVWSKKRKG